MNAMLIYRLARGLRRGHLGAAASLLDAINYLIFGCVIPSHAVIGRGTTIEHRGVAVVLNRNSVIGRDCVIGAQVVIGGRGKGIPGVPVIGDRVYLGAGAKVLGPIRIGDDVVIGANSVVLHDVDSGVTAAGVPARPRTSGAS